MKFFLWGGKEEGEKRIACVNGKTSVGLKRKEDWGSRIGKISIRHFWVSGGGE